MSQKKVDAYKEQKANRAKIMKKEKTLLLLEKIAGLLIGIAVVCWVGYSVYDKATENQPVVRTETVLNTAALDDYMMNVASEADEAEEADETSDEETAEVTEPEDGSEAAEDADADTDAEGADTEEADTDADAEGTDTDEADTDADAEGTDTDSADTEDTADADTSAADAETDE